jgi:hypothetical protein
MCQCLGAWVAFRSCAKGWHLGPAQRRQKCLPIDGEREKENSRFGVLVARTAEANMYTKICTSGESLSLRDMNAVVRENLIQERGFHCFPPCFSLTSPSCVISTPRARLNRLSPKVCHRDHGRTWPRTHLPLKAIAAIL